MNDLELHQHRRPADVTRYAWDPYPHDTHFTRDWWHRTWDLGTRYSLWSVHRAGEEVARLELDTEVYYDHYTGVPELGPGILEIDFFEVSSRARGQGVGTATVDLLAQHFPERRLLAFSEEADRFWQSLGWARYDHPDGPSFYRPLFVAPRGWRAPDNPGSPSETPKALT